METLNLNEMEPYPEVTIIMVDRSPLLFIIPAPVTKTPRLNELQFWGAKFTQLPDLGDLGPQLKWLIISNGLTSLTPSYFTNYRSLEWLHVVSTMVTSVNAEDFVGLENLTELSLRGCPLGTTPGIEDWMPRLRILNLSQIGATHVPRSLLAGLADLETLDVSSNGISILFAAEFLNLRSSLTIDVQDNLLVCDVNLVWLKVSEPT